ncbi:MAG: oligoendopeptidase F, partial [Acholeplasmataceae bacterium]|nr:oligoendopeptidase F [Acholeplasmataceae bacterium]
INNMSKWDLSVFYTNMEAWDEDLKKLPAHVSQLASFQGKLGIFESFKAFYEAEEEATKLLYRLFAYIHLSSDLNLKDQVKSAKNQQVLLMLSDLNQKTSFVAPELIALGEEKVMSFIDRDDYLKTHRFPMEKLFFQQKHVLSGDQEKILANFSATRSVPTSLYQALAIIDASDEHVLLSNDKEVTVTQSNFRSLLPTLKKAEDRQLVFEAAFKRYNDNKAAFASTYNLVLQQQAAYYKSRNYASALDAALFKNNIPTSVFHNLKDVAYENTKPIKRYIALRKKHLNLEKYHTYDRFLKLAHDDTKYPYEEARKLFFEAIDGMDNVFASHQKDAVEHGFVDAYPQDGKRTGAYSSGFYGFHPYILLNHDETLDAVFTLAHEAGHSAHTLFANEHQPMATSDYTIFVAEIASTFNEHVLLDYLISKAKTKNQKIALLESAIDGIMSTFFRQTLFATFEFKANELVEQGVPITDSSLSKIMIDLYKHYYDIDITEENYKQYVWAYIPHFYHTPYYVYQYATSYSASLKIYDNVKRGQPKAMENYLGLLKSGGSDYPVNQATKAGADLTNKDTFMAVINRFTRLIDQLEAVLEEK